VGGSGRLCVAGSDGAELFVAPVPGARVVRKHRFDIWQSAEFHEALVDWDVDGLVIGGVELQCCVLYAVLGAEERGFHYVVPQDLVSGIDRCETTSNQVVRQYLRYVHPSPKSADALLDGWRQRVASGSPVMEPPEMINAGELVLRRWEHAWADEGSVAVRESLPELKPFLPWATDGYDTEASRTFIEKSVEDWDKGTTFNYGIFTAGGDLVGGIGLMTRMGPGVLEIGYWMRTAYTGRGYMTAAVEALTRVALTLPGIERVAIRHDVANVASAAVAGKAGFVEISRVNREPEAPSETGTDVIRERRAGRH
jgi:ribosomal-protein-serine acetyltransferase